jgi:AraC family transcriptional regulator of arabinose operon
MRFCPGRANRDRGMTRIMRQGKSEMTGEPSHGIVIAGHYDEPDTYFINRPYGMEDWLLTFTLSGEGYFTTSGATTCCGAGDLCLLRPGTPHRYGTVRGKRWNFVWAHFTSRIAETDLLPEQELIIHRIESETSRKRVYRAFRRVLSDYAERGLYWPELCEGALREIVLLLAQRLHKRIDPRIEETLHLLASNMREPVRIDALARAVGLSPSRLAHLFKETTGYSIIDTLNRMRVEQAAMLLTHTDRTATEVALDVGFQNYNHFINQFRKRFGTSPRAYKSEKSPAGKGHRSE